MTTMTARYPGKCSVCGGSIHRGETIDYSKDEGARHPVDSECDRAAAKAARKAARKHERREANVAALAAASSPVAVDWTKVE